jgi:ABC-type bacteriocin/lantibiotic exporter with double-glycine peptidase domain
VSQSVYFAALGVVFTETRFVRVLAPVLALVGFCRVAQEARVAGDRLFELMELDPKPVDAQVPLSRNNARDVRLERIHFAYGRRSPALVDVSISFPRGKVTAIVGESGSGKSTIAALLQRLYPVDQGRICIGPCDVAHVELQSLRRLVGVVPQSIDLFAGSILENLTIGEANPDVERIGALCEEVGLRETIERMPQGWLTPVGERGMALSGGERHDWRSCARCIAILPFSCSMKQRRRSIR